MSGALGQQGEGEEGDAGLAVSETEHKFLGSLWMVGRAP